MSTELAVPTGNGISVARTPGGLALTFDDMVARVTQVDRFYREVMVNGTDYGVIPGTDKPTLYQPGAQMLDQIFGYAPAFEVMPASVIDWERPIPFFHYVIRCRLVAVRSGVTVAEGIGSCNSHEDRYRWRTAKRACPSCRSEAIIRGKAEYGGGWVCFKKAGGCGAKFADNDVAITEQAAGRIENPDTASLENTICKMAEKRMHVAATLNATGASRIFTQDVEDLPGFGQAVVAAYVAAGPDEPEPARVRDLPAGAPAREEEPSPRARFDANWRRGVARAVKCGAVVAAAPAPDATVEELNAAQRELVSVIKEREALNGIVQAKLADVRAAGGDPKDVDPATCTEAELMGLIEALNGMLDAANGDVPF